MRKLATKRYVKEVRKHPNADALDLVTVDGWQVVSKLGEFKEGDPCLFLEIDSFIPADDERFAFLAKSGTKKDESGRERIRLKSIKLRKELSQGLALPWSLFPELHGQEKEDYSEDLDIIKYERPEPKVANAAGNFPDCIPRTDEERIQNLWDKYSTKYKDTMFTPTLKLDGSSCTVAYFGLNKSEHWKGEGESLDIFFEGREDEKIGEVAVCSRKLQLKYDENSHFWKAAVGSKVVDAAIELGKIGNFAIQGEVCGPGIQGNKDKFNDYKFYAFALYDIDNQCYVSWEYAKECFNDVGIPHVPEIAQPMYPFKAFSTLEECLEHADGPSINAKYREGIVWKSVGLSPAVSWKAISNKFLLKGGDD